MERHLGRTLDYNEVVHHKNGDPRDNRLENLEVMPRGAHGRLHQTGKPGNRPSEEACRKLSRINTGERHPQAKLNAIIVRYIRRSGMTNKELASELGLSRPIISQVRNRRRWAHVK